MRPNELDNLPHAQTWQETDLLWDDTHPAPGAPVARVSSE
jgi:hypothetical protein